MLILALSDLHNSRRGAETSRRFAAEHRPDLITIAGDITNGGPSDFATGLLSALPATTLVVPGNMDSGEIGPGLSSGKAKNIHLRKEVIEGIPFVGLGGWINSPALGESWGVEPDRAERALSGLMSEGCVLLTHVPPLGHLDRVPVPEVFAPEGSEEHIGSPMVLRLVQRFRPRLVISGHVHECRGIEREAGTVFVNPGPARNGFGALIELENRIEARLLA